MTERSAQQEGFASPAAQPGGTKRRLRSSGIFVKLLKWFLALSLGPLLIFGLRAADQSRKAIATETEEFLLRRANDIAGRVTQLLNQCENDLRALEMMPRTAEAYATFSDRHRSRIWTRTGTNDAPRETFLDLPLYRELSFIGADGLERIRIDTDGSDPLIHHQLREVSDPFETTYRCETYFDDAHALGVGDIFVSHLTGFHLRREDQMAGASRVKDAVEGMPYNGIIRFTTPVEDADGRRVGIITIGLDHRHLQEIVAHVDPLRSEPVLVIDYDSGNYLYLVDDDGWFIAHPKLWDLRGVYQDGTQVPAYVSGQSPELDAEGRTPLNLAEMGWKDSAYPVILETLRKGSQATLELPSLGYGDVEPVMRFRAFAPIRYETPPYDRYGIFGGVALGANSQAIERLGERVTNELQIFLFMVGLAVVVLAILVSRDISRPLIGLAAAARDIGLGNLKRRVEVRGRDEVAEVSDAFNRMSEDLQVSQERLRQAERFASIGEVVSGTAHAIKTELNLYGLINNLAVVERLTPEEDPRKKMIVAIRQGVEGLEHIVHELLDAGPEPHLESIAIRESLGEVLETIAQRCTELNIVVEPSQPDGSLAVLADRDLLHHVLVNICTNALDAMAEGGRLFVSVQLVETEVRIQVRDTGSGIPEELLEKIFYPFFTTKKDQGGTGFGLYQSQRALRRMGGRMELNSQVGQGTTVTVFLPPA